MSIAPQLRQFLDETKAEYDVIEHRPTKSAMETARSCDIPAERLAKAVLLDTADDDHLLAVLPSDRRVELNELRSELGRKPRLSEEAEVGKLFKDCELGAFRRSAMGSRPSSMTRWSSSPTSISKLATTSRWSI